MNKEAEIIARLDYWGLITDMKRAREILITERLMDDKDFGRAYYIKKEIEFKENRANELYKEERLNNERF